MLTVHAQKRELAGKGNARKMRRNGSIPGIYYSHGEEAVSLVFNEKEVSTILHSAHGLLELDVEGGDNLQCVVKEVQFDPVRSTPIHMDLMGVRRGEKITVEVPVHLLGEPLGVKAGGILAQHARDVQIECLPKDLPEHLDVDVSDLEIGESIHASDLSFESVTLLLDPEASIATVLPPKLEQEVVEEEDVEEAEEPEMVGRAKEDTPEEGEE